MATTTTTTNKPELPYQMHVTPDNTGLWRIKQTDEAARKVSDLLQQDLEASFSSLSALAHPYLITDLTISLTLHADARIQNHHVFFNEIGFHNHVRTPS